MKPSKRCRQQSKERARFRQAIRLLNLLTDVQLAGDGNDGNPGRSGPGQTSDGQVFAERELSRAKDGAAPLRALLSRCDPDRLPVPHRNTVLQGRLKYPGLGRTQEHEVVHRAWNAEELGRID